MENQELESYLKNKLCDTLVSKVIEEIKSAILLNKRMQTDVFWFKEEKIINDLIKTKTLKSFFDFKEYWIDIGQPFPNTIHQIFYSKKYDFYYLDVKLYSDFDFVKSLEEDDIVELYILTDRKTKEGSGVLESVYVEHPTIVTVYSFEKPKLYDVPSIKVEYGFYELLETFCDVDTSEISKIVEDYKNTIRGLNRSASYYAKTDDVFKTALFDKVFLNTEDKFDSKEIEYVYNFLASSVYSDTVIRMLFTYNYTCDLYSKHPNDYIDLTFITVSLYKVVEILLCNLVNEKFGKNIIKDRKSKEIDLSRDDLTLGEMNQIFYCDNDEIETYLDNKYPYSDKLRRLLKVWIKYSRNGFLHKDSIEEDETLKESSLNSLDVLFYLILTFSD